MSKIKKPIIREVVIAFRLTAAESQTLSKSFEDEPMLGVKSPSMLARKLALDWSAGRLAYKNAKDKVLAPEFNV